MIKKEVKQEPDTKPDLAALALARSKEQKNADSEIIRDLRAQLKYGRSHSSIFLSNWITKSFMITVDDV